MELTELVGFRELPVVQKQTHKWRELSLDTGSGQGSLETVSVVEKAGGLVLPSPWNRFIYWRTQQGSIELLEESLDARLHGNRLRIKLVNTPILGDSVSLFESHDRYIVLLMSTLGSLHRVAFPHPCLLDASRSVFAGATPSVLKDYNRPSLPGQITLCSNYLTAANDGMFVVGTANSLHLITFYVDGQVQSQELQRTRTIKKRLTGMLPTVIRPREGLEEAPAAVTCFEHENDFLIFALGNDRRLCAWSYYRGEVVSNVSLSEVMGCADSGTPSSGNSRSVDMKRMLNRNLLLVRAFGCFAILKPQVDTHYGVRFTTLVNIPFPETNLVDFGADSSRLWVLYVSARGDPFMAAFEYGADQLVVDRAEPQWMAVHWADPVNGERRTHLQDTGINEEYIDKIFRGDCFGINALTKTVAIFRRTEFGDTLAPFNGSLRDEIIELISLAVDKRLEAGIQEEEAQREVYEKFLSYAVQYHNDGLKPLGIVLGEQLIAVVKADQLGVIQECDDAEQVLLSESLGPVQTAGIQMVVQCLSLVNQVVESEALYNLSMSVFNNGPIEDCIWDLARTIKDNKEFKEPFVKAAKQAARMWPEILSRLIVLIDSEVNDPPLETDVDLLPSLLSGPLSITLMAQNAYQRAMLMYDLCQRLVLFEALLVLNHDEIGLPANNAHSIRTEHLQSTVHTMRCYFLVLWACETMANTNAYLNSMHPVETRSSSVAGGVSVGVHGGNLGGQSGAAATPQGPPMTLMELFLANDNTAVMLGQRRSGGVKDLTHFLYDVTRYNCCLISPSHESSYQLLQVLMEKHQYCHLQEFLRLLSWDPARRGLKHFVLAHALLKSGDLERACDVFISTYEEAINDPFVLEEIGLPTCDPDLVSVIYFQKVIAVFESMDCSNEQVIRLAEAALATKPEPPAEYVIELLSLMFRHELARDRIDKACEALTAIPDIEMQRSCLRELIGTSLDKRRPEVLVEFEPHRALREELLHIMTYRARTSDITIESCLYDLLYCCHTHDRDFRSAASVMFEQGLRLSRELQGFESLAKQELCYLSAMSCLQLLKDRYIVRPKLRKEILSKDSTPGFGSEGDTAVELEEKVEVLELRDVEKELCLVQCWIRLMPHDNSFLTPLSAEETVALLVRNSMYDSVVHLCDLFSLNKSILFENVALACCK
ncbi:nuclear pore complex protein Nup160-like, partial [Tropilaelaps mercedesae]